MTSLTIDYGCRAVKSDAKHDFGDQFDLQSLMNLVDKHSPDLDISEEWIDKWGVSGNKLCKGVSPSTEDTFIRDATGIEPGKWGGSSKPAWGDFVDGELTAVNIAERYTISWISRIQHKPDYTESHIDKYLTSIFGQSTFCIICDVAYANLRQDLQHLMHNNVDSSTFYWLLTTQTSFDPAGKTNFLSNPVTKKAFKTPNSKLKFAWQDYSEANAEISSYKKWDNAGPENIASDDTKKWLFTNKDAYMGIMSDKEEAYNWSRLESGLVIVEGKNFWFADKSLSAINAKFNKSQYTQLGKKCQDMIKTIIDSSGFTYPTFNDEISVLAKRFGDMPQALSCLNKNLNLIEYVNTQNAPNTLKGMDKYDLIPGSDTNFYKFNTQSLGGCYNIFVSYDRIAVAAALRMGVPIVIFNKLNGFVIYSLEGLNDAGLKYDSMKVENKLNTLLKHNFGNNFNSFNENVRIIKLIYSRIKISIHRSLNTIIENETILTDTIYHRFFMFLFSILEIYDLDSLLFQDSFKENYLTDSRDKIFTLLEDFFTPEIYQKISKKNLTQEELDVVSIEDYPENTESNSEAQRLNIIIQELSMIKNKVDAINDIGISIIDKFAEIIDVVINNEDLGEGGMTDEQFLNELENTPDFGILDIFEQATSKNISSTVSKGLASNILSCNPFKKAGTNYKKPKTIDTFNSNLDSIFGYNKLIKKISKIIKNASNIELKSIKSDFILFMATIFTRLSQLSLGNNIYKNYLRETGKLLYEYFPEDIEEVLEKVPESIQPLLIGMSGGSKKNR